MAKNSIRDFDSTAANNTDIQSTDISEGCAASGINNAIREMMADIKDVSTGAVNLETPAADRLDVDNIRIDGNTISSTDTNGDINVIPNGTGEVVFHSTADSDNYVQVSSANNSEAGIRFRGDSSLGTGTDIGYEGNGNRFFISTVSSGTATERVSMDSSGNVGIGTTSPDKLFHLATTDTAKDMIKMSNGTQDFRFGVNNSSDPYLFTYSNDGIRFGTNSSEKMSIQADGEVRIGGSSAYPSGTGIDPVLLVDINGVSGSFNGGLAVNNIASGETAFSTVPNGGHTYYAAIFMNSSTANVGVITCTTTSTAYNTSSDYRLKENVADMTGAIARVKQLAPKRFNFIIEPDITVDGFLAHEAQTVVPEAVHGTHNEVDDDGNAVMQGIDQSKLVPLLTGALKEAITKIETLETEMTALKARVTALEDA